MKISPKKKLEWLWQMNQLARKLSLRNQAFRLKLRRSAG